MPKLTLKEVREMGQKPQPAPPAEAKTMGVRDFLTREEVEELHDRHFERSSARRKIFDQVDSLVGEIIGRFGWEVYEKWNEGEIDSDWLVRILNAERAREKAALTEIESVVYASIVATLAKNPKKPLADVATILKNNEKIIKGEVNDKSK